MDGAGISSRVFGTSCSLGFCCKKANITQWSMKAKYLSIGASGLVEHRTILKLMPRYLGARGKKTKMNIHKLNQAMNF